MAKAKSKSKNPTLVQRFRDNLEKRRKLRLIQDAAATKITAPARLLTPKPPIFLGMLWTRIEGGPFHSIRHSQEFLRDQEAWFFYNLSWNCAAVERCQEIMHYTELNRVRYPRHRIVMLTNTREEMDWFSASGIPAFYCNHNAFVDERIYRPLTGAEAPAKKWDAIYNARVDPLKRHELAAHLDTLALIYYILPEFPHHEHLAAMRQLLKQAWWSNDHLAAGNFIQATQVNEILNASRVGLCLSAEEGAMYSSMEYLMAGLPVVTTHSQGGRDVFFDDEIALVVDDTPEAVAAGVREMISRRLDPEFIRRRTLDRVWEHRERFITLLTRASLIGGKIRDVKEQWGKLFKNRMTDHFERQDPILRRLARNEGWFQEDTKNS